MQRQRQDQAVSAILSDDLRYRYRLEREVLPDGFVIAYFGINPSTADATLDDSTVKKWIGFSERLGARKFIVGNVFAYRATDVGELADAYNPVGSDNITHIENIIADADLLVPCWGNRGKVPKALRPQIDWLAARMSFETQKQEGKPVLVFGRTKSGDPLHPLMLPYATQLTTW